MLEEGEGTKQNCGFLVLEQWSEGDHWLEDPKEGGGGQKLQIEIWIFCQCTQLLPPFPKKLSYCPSPPHPHAHTERHSPFFVTLKIFVLQIYFHPLFLVKVVGGVVGGGEVRVGVKVNSESHCTMKPSPLQSQS